MAGEIRIGSYVRVDKSEEEFGIVTDITDSHYFIDLFTRNKNTAASTGVPICWNQVHPITEKELFKEKLRGSYVY